MRSAFMVCLVPVVACQAQTPSATEHPPEPSEAPITFSVVGDAPVIEPADYGAAYLLPGAAVVHDDTYHLFPVAFYSGPAEAPRVLHLVSEDGASWTGDPSASAGRRSPRTHRSVASAAIGTSSLDGRPCGWS